MTLQFTFIEHELRKVLTLLRRIKRCHTRKDGCIAPHKRRDRLCPTTPEYARLSSFATFDSPCFARSRRVHDPVPRQQLLLCCQPSDSSHGQRYGIRAFDYQRRLCPCFSGDGERQDVRAQCNLIVPPLGFTDQSIMLPTWLQNVHSFAYPITLPCAHSASKACRKMGRKTFSSLPHCHSKCVIKA